MFFLESPHCHHSASTEKALRADQNMRNKKLKVHFDSSEIREGEGPKVKQEAVLWQGCPLQPPSSGDIALLSHRGFLIPHSPGIVSTRNCARVSKRPDSIPGEASRRGIPVPKLLLFCFYARVI